jgi:hypothetical protein
MLAAVHGYGRFAPRNAGFGDARRHESGACVLGRGEASRRHRPAGDAEGSCPASGPSVWHLLLDRDRHGPEAAIVLGPTNAHGRPPAGCDEYGCRARGATGTVGDVVRLIAMVVGLAHAAHRRNRVGGEARAPLCRQPGRDPSAAAGRRTSRPRASMVASSRWSRPPTRVFRHRPVSARGGRGLRGRRARWRRSMTVVGNALARLGCACDRAAAVTPHRRGPIPRPNPGRPGGSRQASPTTARTPRSVRWSPTRLPAGLRIGNRPGSR